jgi:uncharacterized protein
MPVVNGIGWFEIGTGAPAEAEAFYGDVFGWTFSDDDSTENYRLAHIEGAPGPQGGIAAGTDQNYAIFYLVVTDLAATCARVEAAGGKVLVPPATNSGGLAFAHVSDPAGNHFGVFTPPPR